MTGRHFGLSAPEFCGRVRYQTIAAAATASTTTAEVGPWPSLPLLPK